LVAADKPSVDVQWAPKWLHARRGR
jgi:hypothetical protein